MSHSNTSRKETGDNMSVDMNETITSAAKDKAFMEIDDHFKDSSFEEAKEAFQREHDVTFRQAIKTHWKALAFSAGISLSIIMEGYDMALMGNFFAVEPFRERYGVQLADGTYQFPTEWQAGIGAIPNVGAIAGLVIVGRLVERVGFKKSMTVALFWLAAGIFIPFFAQNRLTLLMGQLFCGFPWGMFQGMASTYAADVAPLVLRPALTSYINLCWGVGQFLVTGVLRGSLTLENQWSYRIPFAIQWIWVPLILTVVVFAPESPWWLMRKGRIEDARASLRSLTSKGTSQADIDMTLKLIQLTDEHERSIQAGTSYRDLFKGANKRRTEITALTWLCQVTCGTFFSSHLSYFMATAGVDDGTAFNFAMGMTAVNIAGNIASWFIAARVGRRPMFLTGLAAMLLTELIVGFLGIPNRDDNSLLWGIAALLIMNNVIYFMTIGPLAYMLVADLPSARLRQCTIPFARATYLVGSISANFLQTALINPTGWDLGAKGVLVWAFTCFLSMVYIYFRLPETKDRSPAEMDLLFEKGVSARKFKGATVDLDEIRG